VRPVEYRRFHTSSLLWLVGSSAGQPVSLMVPTTAAPVSKLYLMPPRKPFPGTILSPAKTSRQSFFAESRLL
jgi:hypothetical protein